MKKLTKDIIELHIQGIAAVFIVTLLVVGCMQLKKIQDTKYRVINAKLSDMTNIKQGDFYCKINTYSLLKNEDSLYCNQIAKFVEVDKQLYVALGTSTRLEKVEGEFFIVKQEELR